MKHILVTGDRGYIGSALIPLLLKNKYKVTGIDTDFYSHNQNSDENNSYRKITKDIRHVTEDDLTGVDTIIHLAALSNDPMGELSPDLTNEINYEATFALAKKAKKRGVKRFIFSSSCSIYGIVKNGIVDESSPTNPLTAYAHSKIKSEKALTSLADPSFCVCLMRNSTVYGHSPRFRNDLVVNNLVTCGLALNTIKILSDGTPWRPLIDVRDLSTMFLLFTSADSKMVNGKIFNVGFRENNIQVKDILLKIQNVLPDCSVIYTGEHGKDTRSYQVSFDTLHSTFPHIIQEWPLENSIKNLVETLRQNKYSKDDFLSGKHTRLKVLQDLLNGKKLDKKLYWNEKNSL